jgi:GTPase
LGHKFLRHIRRTSLIFHCISFENADTEYKDIYKTIRKELENFDEVLANKEEVIILTKTDVLDASDPKAIKESQKIIEKRVKYFEKLGKQVFTVTVLDDASVKNLKDNLVKLLRSKAD